MTKNFSNTTKYGYTPKGFRAMSEYERLIDIYKHSRAYAKELPKRKKMAEERLKSGRDGYTKNRMDGIRTSRGGGHADQTADIAIEKAYMEKLLRDDVTFVELLAADEDNIPDAYKDYFLLKRSMFMYDRVVDLFPDNIADILRRQAEGYTIEGMVEKVHLSRTSIVRNLRESREQISCKIIEVLDTYAFNVEDYMDELEEDFDYDDED